MLKICIYALLCFNLLSAATLEQVEAFMSVSGSEEAFMKMEKDFEKIQSLCEAEANGTEERYATELLSIRFKEYFEEHVSDAEMESVLDAYKNVLF